MNEAQLLLCYALYFGHSDFITKINNLMTWRLKPLYFMLIQAPGIGLGSVFMQSFSRHSLSLCKCEERGGDQVRSNEARAS
jgi:hypothetical protein